MDREGEFWMPFFESESWEKIENFFSFFLKNSLFFRIEGDENLRNFSEKLK